MIEKSFSYSLGVKLAKTAAVSQGGDSGGAETPGGSSLPSMPSTSPRAPSDRKRISSLDPDRKSIGPRGNFNLGTTGGPIIRTIPDDPLPTPISKALVTGSRRSRLLGGEQRRKD